MTAGVPVAEAALRDAQAQLRDVLDGIGEAVYMLDRDWRIVNVSRSALELWGKRADEVIGRTLLDLFPHAADGEAHQAQQRAFETGRPEHLETHSPALGRWIALGITPGTTGLCVSIRDIDAERGQRAAAQARKEMEAALRASEERFRSFAENSADVLWIMDAEMCCLLYLSPAFERIWGEPRDAVMRDLSRWAELIHPEDRERALDALPRLLAGGTQVAEYRIRRPDGGVRWIRDTGFAIRDAEGGIARVAGIAQDVTDERQAQEALRSNEARLRVLSETIPQLVWTSLADGQCDWAGPQWQAFTGLSEPASHGRGWCAALHPDDRERAVAAWRDASGEGRGGSLDLAIRIRRHDGAWRWFQARAVPVPMGHGAELRWFGTCTDLDDIVRAREVLARGREHLEELVAERTADLRQAVDALHTEVLERERTEETLRQSQKMEAVGQLTGGIAHDFNNMLQGIAGGLEMVQRRIADGRAAETGRYIEASLKVVERAAGLTHRLLAFARRQALDPRAVDADALVVGMEDLIGRTVGPAIQVELRPSGRVATGCSADGSPSAMGDGRWMVLCDANQLENALLNLCINARDAMPDGGRLTIGTQHVSLSATDVLDQGEACPNRASPGDYVAVVVSDTGTGMPPEVLARAFEPFFTTKPMGQGTGLGLSQIYGFVRQSNGAVRLESAPGRGTTVRLLLPRHEAVRADEDQRAAPGSARRAGGTVLLVEDEATVRELVAEHLRELGYTVLEAEDGPAALRLLGGASRVDLLVTDVGLPGGLNGRQVADAARERRPGLKVLFITGYAGSALEGQLAPHMELIGKPFTLDALAGRVRAMLI